MVVTFALSQCSPEGGTGVYVKIADLGISRIMSPGGTMGFKGSPGFMAPEILKYVGMEAVTEKVSAWLSSPLPALDTLVPWLSPSAQLLHDL